MTVPDALDIETLGRIVTARVQRMTGELAQAVGLTVHSGPFNGMTLSPQVSWGDGSLAPKILGCYEAELHPSLERFIARKPQLVVNVGCAEGYYAVGLARRLPAARVVAFDISAEAQRACAAAAALNDVAARVEVRGECTAGDLVALTAGHRRALIVMDCEGAERDLLTGEAVAQLRHCDLIVELHDFVDRTISDTLGPRLSATHRVEVLREGPRDPSAVPELRQLCSLDRALLVNEMRPELMYWLACTAR